VPAPARHRPETSQRIQGAPDGALNEQHKLSAARAVYRPQRANKELGADQGPRGAAKKKTTKATYICRSAKKKVVTYFIFIFIFIFILSNFFRALFGRFVTRGVQKHEKNFLSKKNPSGITTKNAAFVSSVFFLFFLGCFDQKHFIAFLGIS
jgi:hypothetical protein